MLPTKGYITDKSGAFTDVYTLPANPLRLSYTVQNNSLSTLTLTWPNGVTEILPGCSISASDGTGGIYYDDELRDAVAFSGIALSYTVIEVAA